MLDSYRYELYKNEKLGIIELETQVIGVSDVKNTYFSTTRIHPLCDPGGVTIVGKICTSYDSARKKILKLKKAAILAAIELDMLPKGFKPPKRLELMQHYDSRDGSSYYVRDSNNPNYSKKDVAK